MRVIHPILALLSLAAAKAIAEPEPEITPAPVAHPLPNHIAAFQALQKRGITPSLPIKKRASATCYTDCGNGYCCGLYEICVTSGGNSCKYPDFSDVASLLSSYDITGFSFDLNSYLSAYTTDYNGILSNIYEAYTINPKVSSILVDHSVTRWAGNAYPTNTSPSFPDSSSKKGKKKAPVGAIVGGLVAGLVFLALVITVILLIRKNNKSKPVPVPTPTLAPGEPYTGPQVPAPVLDPTKIPTTPPPPPPPAYPPVPEMGGNGWYPTPEQNYVVSPISSPAPDPNNMVAEMGGGQNQPAPSELPQYTRYQQPPSQPPPHMQQQQQQQQYPGYVYEMDGARR